MPRIDLSSGPIDYQDTGGHGPVLVFCHGVPMNHTQWRKVIPLLAGFRCVLPTLPLGGHRAPMSPTADLSQRGVALMLAEFLDQLDLRDVTLALNDWGGGQLLISEGRAGRLAGLVLVACEAFDNFPPGPARLLSVVAGLPGGVWLLAQAMRLGAVRRAKERLRRHEPARHTGRRPRRLVRPGPEQPGDPARLRQVRHRHARPGDAAGLE
jgi:pimeloyl-ACP methyl ester carboxylesterase